MSQQQDAVFPEHIGQVIRVFRLKRRLPRVALAARLSIAPQVLAGIEDGKRAGLPTVKGALLNELGLTPGEFDRVGRFAGFRGLRTGDAAYLTRPDYADDLDRLAAMPARERRLDWQHVLSELIGLDTADPPPA